MKDKPHVIVIKTDQQRFDLSGCMGHPIIKTPNIDALAAEGILFEQAHTVSTLCVPSRTSFFRGTYVKNTGSVDNSPSSHIQGNEVSLVDPFKQAGYAVGLAGKNHAFANDYLDRVFDYCEQYGHHGKEKGTITESDQKVIDYFAEDDRFPGAKDTGLGKLEGLFEESMPFPPEECPTMGITMDALHFIDKCLEEEKPFFLHYSFPEPHWPNVVCEPYHSLYDPESIELEAYDHDWEKKPFAHFVQSRAYGFNHYTPLEMKRVVAAYWGQITFIDHAIGILVKELKERGIYDKTLIVFTSDHGDYAGRYGLVAKTKAFYDSLVRIPLIIKMPRSEFSGRIKASVSNIDVMPTLVEAAGLPCEFPSDQNGGISLLPVIKGERVNHRVDLFAEVGSCGFPPLPLDRDKYEEYNREQESEKGVFWFIDYTVKGRSLMIKRNNWKYCFYTGDGEELYDLENDPLELNNLAGEERFRKKKDELNRRLFEWYINDPGRGYNPNIPILWTTSP